MYITVSSVCDAPDNWTKISRGEIVNPKDGAEMFKLAVSYGQTILAEIVSATTSTQQKSTVVGDSRVFRSVSKTKVCVFFHALKQRLQVCDQ